VGTAGRITITASIVATSDGAVRASSEVAGPADSVPALVDRLAAELLVGAASLDDALPTRSIAALRAYLAGRAAYRRGNYDGATQHLTRALAHDSTLIQAALLVICAQAWGAPVADLPRVQRIAWDGRDRFSARDRARLEALLGPRFPEPPLQSEILALSERAVEMARDNPDAWYLFGDAYFHDGAYLGYEDYATRARAALERALALDSAFTDPLGHLIELAARRGDTSDVRRLAALYMATEGARRGIYSVSVRYQIGRALGDQSLTAEALQALDTVAGMPEPMVFIARNEGAHDDVERMLAALLSRASTRGERRQVALLRMTVLMNQGRVREGLAVAESAGLDPSPIRVQVAMHLPIVDSAPTMASVRNVARVAAGPLAAEPRDTVLQYGAIAVLGQWAIVNGDAAGASRAAARLRAMPTGPSLPARYAAVWAELLDGHAAALRGLASARAHADRADSLLRLGAALWAPAPENIILARLYDALGDAPKGLAAVRRGSPQGNNFLQSWLWREEGRLAAKVGDRAGALTAYQRFLTLLWNPDTEIAAVAEAVRREIAALDR
jgi:tetratricopeptide (TPR) repeat protein